MSTCYYTRNRTSSDSWLSSAQLFYPSLKYIAKEQDKTTKPNLGWSAKSNFICYRFASEDGRQIQILYINRFASVGGQQNWILYLNRFASQHEWLNQILYLINFTPILYLTNFYLRMVGSIKFYSLSTFIPIFLFYWFISEDGQQNLSYSLLLRLDWKILSYILCIFGYLILNR